jgi:hypothetical protein
VGGSSGGGGGAEMASTPSGGLLHSGATTAREPVVKGKDQYRPRDDSFTQCTLRCQRPILTAGHTAVGLAVMACLFLPFGCIALAASRSVVEISVRYDNDAGCGGGGATNVEREAQLMEMQGEGVPCGLELNVPTDMTPPVYVYYELRNFYQNHRRCGEGVACLGGHQGLFTSAPQHPIFQHSRGCWRVWRCAASASLHALPVACEQKPPRLLAEVLRSAARLLPLCWQASPVKRIAMRVRGLLASHHHAEGRTTGKMPHAP